MADAPIPFEPKVGFSPRKSARIAAMLMSIAGEQRRRNIPAATSGARTNEAFDLLRHHAVDNERQRVIERARDARRHERRKGLMPVSPDKH